MWESFRQFGHAVDGAYEPGFDLEAEIAQLSMQTVTTATIILVVLLLAAILAHKWASKLSTPLFVLIIIDVVFATAMLIGSTIYLNVNSVSKGPAHYHADFEVWACGQEVNLRDPVGTFSNKIGTATLHEHNDKRIHLEGVVVDERDASLGKFLYVIGGAITNSNLIVPVNSPGDIFNSNDIYDKRYQRVIARQFLNESHGEGMFEFIDGQKCPAISARDTAKDADVQVFVYEIGRNPDGSIETRIDQGREKAVYYQRKLDNPADFVISGESLVPNGDCIIIEFDANKLKTDKICEQYAINDTGRKIIDDDGQEVDSLGNIIYGGLKGGGK